MMQQGPLSTSGNTVSIRPCAAPSANWLRALPVSLLGRRMALMLRQVAAHATLNRHLALDALARAVPIATVVAVLAERGATERRTRTPPGLITIFFCIAMNLHAGDCRTHVFRQLALGSCSLSKRYCR